MWCQSKTSFCTDLAACRSRDQDLQLRRSLLKLARGDIGRAKTAVGETLGRWHCQTGGQCSAGVAHLPYHIAEVHNIVLALWSGQYSEFWAVASLCCLVSVLRLLWTTATGYTDTGSAGRRAQGYSLRKRNGYTQTWKAKLC